MFRGSGAMSATSLDVSSHAGREGKKVNFIQAPMCGTGGPGATVFPASTVASSALSSSGPSSLASCLPSSSQEVSRKTCGGQASKVEEGCSSFLQAVDGEIPRPTSAPPHLEKFSASTLFAFPPSGSTVNRLIDIRCDELYQEFYRHLSQTNPNLPKPLEEDHSFLDLASQKKGRCRSSRGRYTEHARNGATEGPLSCCPALTSSFSSTSHTSGVTEDEEGTTTASTRRLSTAAAVNAAAALAFVDELQHRHEGCGLIYSNRSALSLGMASSSCRNDSRTGVSPQAAVAGGGGQVISAGRFTAAPPASSGDTGYYRGPGRAGSDGRNSLPAVVASTPGGAPGYRGQMGIEEAGPSLSAAAAAALLQDAHAAWKESGGSAALLPVVQKWKEAILSRCPDANHLQTSANNGVPFSTESGASQGSIGRLGGHDARCCTASNSDFFREGHETPASGQGSVVLVLPVRNDVPLHGVSVSNTSNENTVENRSRSTSQPSSERHAGTNAVVVGPSSSGTGGTLMARGIAGQSGINQTSPRGLVETRQTDSAAVSGVSTCEPESQSDPLRVALSAASPQEHHLLQAFAALGVTQQPTSPGTSGGTAHRPDAGAGLLALTKSTLLDEAASAPHQSTLQANTTPSGGDTTPVLGFHPALSLSGALGTTPAEAAALLSAVAGASAVVAPSSGMVSQGSAGLGLHLANNNGGLAGGGHPHRHEPGGGSTSNSTQALGTFAALGQAFQRDVVVGADDRGSAAADVPSAAEVVGNAQLLSSVLYPLLNAGLAPVALTPGPPSSTLGMVFGSPERDPRASVPCMIDSAALLPGHPGVYQAGSLPRPQSLGVNGQAFPSSAAALFASAAKLSGTAPPPGIPSAAHHLMFSRGGGDLDLHGDMIQQESAAAHAATPGTGGAAGMQTWVGLEGASRGHQPMFLGGPAGLDAVGLEGTYLRSHAAQLGVILPHSAADSSTEPSGSGSSQPGSQNADVITALNSGPAKGRSGRWIDRGKKLHQTAGHRESKSATRLGTSTASGGGRKREAQGLGRLGGDSGGGMLGGALSLAAAEDLVFGNRYRGKIDVIARDQIGCRMLQRKLSEGDADEAREICAEVLEHAVSLLVDPFGNYLVQKVIEECEEPQLLQLVRKIRPRITDVCLSPHGTRAVQKLIEVSASLPVTSQVSAELLAALKISIVLLAKDVNANHVVQKLLVSFPPSRCDFIFSQVKQQCVEICKERHGCCVMQRCIDAAPPQAKSEILLEITANALELIQDAFGNYVVQYVLDLQQEALNSAVARKLQGHIRELSVQKFASNVVEKFLILGSAEQRNAIVQELLSDCEGLRAMLLDSYANYVVQRALTVASPPLQQQLLHAIQPCLPQLRQTQQGNRVAHKLMKKFPSLVASLASSGGASEGFTKEEEKKAKSSNRANTKAAMGSSRGSALKGEGGRNSLRQRKAEKADEEERQQSSVSRTSRARRKP